MVMVDAWSFSWTSKLGPRDLMFGRSSGGRVAAVDSWETFSTFVRHGVLPPTVETAAQALRSG
jgi:hypothetical protein